MNDPVEPIDSGEIDLAPAQQQPGSLLRLRDVQALNRSFRRLAEVQEVLLDRLEELEEEKIKQSKFNSPLLAISGMVLGVGLTAVAFVYMQPASEILVQQEPAPITITQPEIVIQAPDNTELNDNFAKLSESLSAVISAQKFDREQMSNLTAQILSSENQNSALRQAMADIQEKHQQELEELKKRQPTAIAMPALQVPPIAAPALAPTVPVSELVLKLNALLAADGYSKNQFQVAKKVDGVAELNNVIMLSWDSSGKLESMIDATTVKLELHKMSHTVVMTFSDGSRTVGGAAKVALPEEGVRLEFSEVNVDVWVEQFPELIIAGSAAKAPQSVNNSGQVKVALDSLISKRGSFSYYKLSALGEINGDELRYVQINWHDNSGRLVKTIEADSLLVVLHKSGSVELQMRNGAFLSGNQRSPFSSDRFSLHLPRQDIQLWRDSIVPTREVGF